MDTHRFVSPVSAGRMPLVTCVLVGALLFISLGEPTAAQDFPEASWGVVGISSQTALDGDASIGDAPGFPVTIGAPGSYRLTSNLYVRDGAAVEILVSNVTLDLNGFSISGPIVCSGPPPRCTPVPGVAPEGIVAIPSAAPLMNVTVQNGTVSGLARAVFLPGQAHVVERLRVVGNLSGVWLGAGIVEHTTFALNASFPLRMSGGLLSHSVFFDVDRLEGIGGQVGVWVTKVPDMLICHQGPCR